MARRGLVAIGLLLICIIAMLVFKGLFKKKVQEGFAVGDQVRSVTTISSDNATGITMNPGGNYLYIVYKYSNSVGRLDKNGSNYTQIGSAAFNEPEGIAVDSLEEYLYVADTKNNRICKVTIADGTVMTLAGSTTAGSPTSPGDITGATGAAARFNTPHGITISKNNTHLYVTDSGNNAIRKVRISDGQVTTVDLTPANLLNIPRGITRSSDDRYLYVVDSNNNRILRINTNPSIIGGTVEIWAGIGSRGSKDGFGTVAAFNQPYGIVTDSSNNLYVTDKYNNTIRKIVNLSTAHVQKTEITTIASYSINVANYSQDRSHPLNQYDQLIENSDNIDGIGSAARFNQPQGITIDSSGTLYVVDFGIRKIEMICGAGTYRAAGSTTCTPCSAGTYSLDGATTCLTCSINNVPNATEVNIGSTTSCPATACKPGYKLSGGQCLPCDPGTYSSGGTVSSCTTCSPNIANGEKTMAPSTTICKPSACLAGYELLSVNGQNQCSQCPNGKYSADGSPCITCELSTGATTMATSKISCTASACEPGYYLSEGKCVISPAGSFSAGGTATSSTPCAAGSYSAARATSCTACAAGSYNNRTGASSCTACGTSLGAKTMGESTTKCEPSVCSGGYKLSSVNGVNQCSKCLAGTYSGEGATTCTTCAPRTFSADGATTCASCQPGTGEKTMKPSLTECTPLVCLAGYKLSGGRCVKCGAGSSSVEGSTTCRSCSAGSSSSDGSACSLCLAGSYSGEGASACTTCSQGTYNKNPGSSSCEQCSVNNIPGADSVISSPSSCTVERCLLGNKLVDGRCVQCGAGFYGANGTTCTQCISGSSSIAGSTSASDCKCPANSYGTNNSCTACPANSGSPLGSSSISDCKCLANYYSKDGECKACPAGSTSPANSTSINECRCSGGKILIVTGENGECTNMNQAARYATKSYNPGSITQYTGYNNTKMSVRKNTDLCSQDSTDPCCSDAGSGNYDCIKNKYWIPNYAFDKINSGFEDYGAVSSQGMHLLNQKRAKMNRVV